MGESECFECKCLLYDRCAQRERTASLIKKKEMVIGIFKIALSHLSVVTILVYEICFIRVTFFFFFYITNLNREVQPR